MAYSVEVIRRARERLAQEKEDREAEYRRHLAQAYTQVPRIREIDLQLRKTVAQAAQAAFASGEDAQQILNRAREENLALQRERADLAAVHFEEGFLNDAPICDRCGGTGYVGSTMCECLRELCRQEQKKTLTLLAGGKESFGQFRLDYYPNRVDPETGVNIRALMEKTLATCKAYAYGFSQRSGNLLLSGGTGLGKTFLSACIARAVADGGHSVIYETAPHLFARLEKARFGGDEEARRETEKYTQCDLLILDDLGTELPGTFVTAALYSLLNDRILGGLPMVVSTNLGKDAFEKRYSPQIASRLRGNFRRVPFLGEDIRILKSQEF